MIQGIAVELIVKPRWTLSLRGGKFAPFQHVSVFVNAWQLKHLDVNNRITDFFSY